MSSDGVAIEVENQLLLHKPILCSSFFDIFFYVYFFLNVVVVLVLLHNFYYIEDLCIVFF